MNAETTTLTLVEFLLARIADEEQWADAISVAWHLHDDIGSPTRVRAECEAKRRIVERCNAVDFAMPCTSLAHGILMELARPYTGHPDFERVGPVR